MTLKKIEYRYSNNIIMDICLLILGLLLVSNSNNLLTTIFNIIGLLLIFYGIYLLIKYSKMKQMKIEDLTIRNQMIFYITSGILTIILSNFLVNMINILTGLFLLFIGISRLVNNKFPDKVNSIGTIIIILMGIYSILVENAALVLIGLLLICYVILDIVNYFNNKKRVH